VFSGAGGIEVEPNPISLFGNEDYLLLINDLLDAVEAMGKSNKNSGALL